MHATSNEGEPLEHVPSSSPGARISVESNAEAPSGWSSESSSAKFRIDVTDETQAVLDKVALFHQHHHARGKDAATNSLHRTLSIHTTALEQTYMTEECDENDYHLDLDTYQPVQPLANDHGVALFPVGAPHAGMNHHVLQVSTSSCDTIDTKFVRTYFKLRGWLVGCKVQPGQVSR